MFLLLDGVLRAVDEIDSGRRSLDDVLDDPEFIPPEVRRIASYWLFSFYRYRSGLEQYIREFSSKGKIKRPLFMLAAVGIAHAAFQDRVARESSVNAVVEYAKVKLGVSESRFINALLRKVCRENPVFEVHLPVECAKRWRKIFGHDFIEQAEKCLAAEPEQSFRLRNGFELEGITAEKISDPALADFCFYRTEKITETAVSYNGTEKL
jgi:hypothetical protein